MTRLKTCPFCGEVEPQVEEFNIPFKGHSWAVCCPNCGAMSHPSIDREVAETRWNERAKDQ